MKKRIGGTCTVLGSSRGNPLVNAEAAATVSPKHIRQRCRPMRRTPVTPPARTNLMSSIAAMATKNVKLYIATRTEPSRGVALLKAGSKPVANRKLRIARAHRGTRAERKMASETAL